MMKFLALLVLVGTKVSGYSPNWLSEVPKGRLLKRTSERCSKEREVTERGICLKSALDNQLYIYVRVERPAMEEKIRQSLRDDQTKQVRFREAPRGQSDEAEPTWATSRQPEACPDSRCRLMAPTHTEDDVVEQGPPLDGRSPRPLQPAWNVQAQPTRELQPKTNKYFKGVFAMKEVASRLLCHSSRPYCQTGKCGNRRNAKKESRAIQHTEGRCECVKSQPRRGFPGCSKFLEAITCRKGTRATGR